MGEDRQEWKARMLELMRRERVPLLWMPYLWEALGQTVRDPGVRSGRERLGE